MLDLEGPIAPLATPFTDDTASVSEIRLERLLAQIAAGPVRTVMVAGETGEFTTLSLSERKLILEIAVRWIPRGFSVVAHVSALSTSASLDLAQHASRHGAAAVVTMPPFYGRYTEEEIAGHVTTLAMHADLPVIVTDPFGLVSGRVREAIEQRREIQIASPLAGASAALTDAFQLGRVHCSPEFLLNADAALDADQLRVLLAAAGPARLSKALLQSRGIDLGPPRAPLRSLPPTMRAHLDSLRAA